MSAEAAPRDERSKPQYDWLWSLGLLALGIAISVRSEIYDLRSPAARIVATLLGTVASFRLFWLGLVVLRAEASDRARASLVALLPWNSLLLSQIPYVGNLM